MKFFLPLLALLFLGFSAGAARDPVRPKGIEDLEGFEKMPPDAANFDLYIEVMIVQLPKAVAVRFLPQLLDPKQIDAAAAKLLEMTGGERARLVEWPMVVTRNGERGVSESVDEIRYATEFAGGRTIKENLADIALFSEIQKQPVPGEVKQPAIPRGVAAAIDPIPTSFETRNVGVVLEANPSIDPFTMVIDTQLFCQHVHYAGMEKATIETQGRKIAVEHPRFHTAKTSTSVATRSGQRLLLGSFRAPDRPDWVELFLYRAVVRPIPKPGK